MDPSLPSPLLRPGDGSGGMFQPGWPCLLSLYLNRNWSKLETLFPSRSTKASSIRPRSLSSLALP